MSDLSSSSSRDEVIAAYVDNASFEEDASLAKARAFITACRILLVKLPRRAESGAGGGTAIELSPALVRDELARARAWLAANGGARGPGGTVAPTVKHFSIEEGFRG